MKTATLITVDWGIFLKRIFLCCYTFRYQQECKYESPPKEVTTTHATTCVVSPIEPVITNSGILADESPARMPELVTTQLVDEQCNDLFR